MVVAAWCVHSHYSKVYASHYGFYNKKADKKGKVLGPSFLNLLKEYDTWDIPLPYSNFFIFLAMQKFVGINTFIGACRNDQFFKIQISQNLKGKCMIF